MLCVIFDAEERLLGVIHKQTIRQTVGFEWTPLGKTLLESESIAWRTDGIPVLEEKGVPTTEGYRRLVGSKRIPLQAQEAKAALLKWMQMQGFTALSLEEENRESVKKILHLPLAPREKQTLLKLLSRAPKNRQEEWKTLLAPL